MQRIEELCARVDADPSDEQALEELVTTACAAEDWDLATTALQQWVEVTADPDTQVRAMMRLAAIAEEQLGDLQAAADAYQRILELDPARTAAASALERIRNLRG